MTTAQVAAVLKLCHAQNQPVVAHGGLTGRVKGARTSSEEMVISLERMRKRNPDKIFPSTRGVNK